MHPFVRYSLREATRAWLLRADAAWPHAKAWNRVRLGVLLVLLLLTWSSVGPVSEFAAQHPLAAPGSALAAAGGLFVILGSLVLGLLAGVAVAGQVLDSEPLVRAWPVPRVLIFVPETVSTWAQGAFLVLLSTAPAAAVFVGASAPSAPGRMIVAAVAALAAYLVAAAVCSLVGALVLRLRSGANAQATLAGLVIVAFGLLVASVVLVSSRLAAGGFAGLVDAAAGLDKRLGAPVLAGVGGGGRAAGLLIGLAVPVVGGGLLAASALLERARERLAAGGGTQVARAFAGPFSGALLQRLGPFLRKDFLIAQREPGILLRQVLVVVLFLLLLLRILPSGKDDAVLLFVVMTLPATLCGVTLLHAIGQEGTLLQMIRMLGAVDRFLASKLTVGLVVVPLVSAGLAALGLGVVLDLAWTHFVGLLVFVTLASVLDVLLALGLGSVCADLSVKRLAKERGISLLGELAFWTLSGFISFGFFLVADAVLEGRRGTTPGLVLVLVCTATTAVLYQRGRAKLLAPTVC